MLAVSKQFDLVACVIWLGILQDPLIDNSQLLSKTPNAIKTAFMILANLLNANISQ